MTHDQQVEMRLLELLADRPSSVQETAVDMRRLVAKLAKHSSEMLYQTYAVSNVFTFTGKLGQAFIHIATYGQHVNLGFNQGARLDDPDGLLKGSGKAIRHIRIDSAATMKSKPVKLLILQAIQQGVEMAEGKTGIEPKTFIDKSSK